MLCKVVEKEFPLWHLPQTRHFMIVEANHKGSYKIEFSSEVGERTERFNSLDYAVDTEKLRNVEKVSCATAEIQNPLRSRQIEFELANPADIDFDPTFEVEIFRPVRAGICDRVSPTNLLERSWIDCFDHPFCIKREAIG